MFGKVMSITDEAMAQYFTLLTDFPLDQVKTWLGPEMNPRDAKEILGKAIVEQYWGREAAEAAALAFRKRSEGQDPDDIPEVAIDPSECDSNGAIAAFRLVVLLKFEDSGSNARRVIDQGGFNVGPDRTVIKEPKTPVPISDGLIVRVGKRKIARVVIRHN